MSEEICKTNQFHPIGPTIEKQNPSCVGQIIFNSSINAEMVQYFVSTVVKGKMYDKNHTEAVKAIRGNYKNNFSPKIVVKSRSSRPEVLLEKGVLKICSKFTGEHPYQSVISINFQRNFIEITLRHGCSPLNLLHIFRIPFPKNTSRGLRFYVCNRGNFQK